ncbi:MAG TPA: PhoH family protein [Elusimicrobiota bacterium]|jgi:phosphate starvation-inducible PhoH-like protein|nr:PhoH family protein [Elusimicrobiota bacterium]
MVTKQIKLHDPQETVRLLGEQDARLRELQRDFGVEIVVRQNASDGELQLNVRGASARVEKAVRRLREELDALRRRAAPAAPDGFEPINLDSPSLPQDGLYRTHHGRVVRPRTPNQEKYTSAIAEHDLTFGVGPAGTGKTYLAVACALRALESRQVEKVILSRPVVEAGERLGFLPGDLMEKVNPYLRPLYDAFLAMLGPERFRAWRDNDVVEIVPLAYMRGRTFEDAFMILDEAQNTTPEQIKMFLTRMGTGSKAVVTGDLTQNDLPARTESGLQRVIKVLKGVDGVATIALNETDVVRHPLVKRIIRAYDQWDEKA